MIIQHPPFWENNTLQFNSNNWLGMYTAVCYNNKVCGQSGSRVLRFSGSGFWVPCGHGQNSMAAQVWHWMSQALLLGCSFEQLAWQEQLGPSSSGLLVSQVQWKRAACACAGGGNAGCAAEKQCLVGSCSVAVVPLGTVLTGFDTAFEMVSPHAVVCRTIAGAYLIAVPW